MFSSSHGKLFSVFFQTTIYIFSWKYKKDCKQLPKIILIKGFCSKNWIYSICYRILSWTVSISFLLRIIPQPSLESFVQFSRTQTTCNEYFTIKHSLALARFLDIPQISSVIQLKKLTLCNYFCRLFLSYVVSISLNCQHHPIHWRIW